MRAPLVVLLASAVARAAVAAEPCPVVDDGVPVGTVAAAEITEASGMVASRRNPGVLWVHNDSGSPPRLFALGTDGTPRAVFELTGVAMSDWEDVALGPGPRPGTDYLYVGDVGDNLERRPFVRVHRVAEPAVDGAGATTPVPLSGATTLEARYPDGPHDAEALLSDPRTGDLFVVTKTRSACIGAPGDGCGVSKVFRWPFPQAEGGRATLEEVATLRFDGPAAGRLASAGDVSPDGGRIIVRTYTQAFLWRRADGASIADALATPPCVVSVPGFPAEPQGESVAFAPDGQGYFTVSEGRAPPIYRFGFARDGRPPLPAPPALR